MGMAAMSRSVRRLTSSSSASTSAQPVEEESRAVRLWKRKGREERRQLGRERGRWRCCWLLHWMEQGWRLQLTVSVLLALESEEKRSAVVL